MLYANIPYPPTLPYSTLTYANPTLPTLLCFSLGYLNFEEFTMFMYYIVSRCDKGVWKKVNFDFDYTSLVHQLFTAPNPLEGLKTKKRGRWGRRGSGADSAGGDNNQSAATGGSPKNPHLLQSFYCNLILTLIRLTNPPISQPSSTYLPPIT